MAKILSVTVVNVSSIDFALVKQRRTAGVTIVQVSRVSGVAVGLEGLAERAQAVARWCDEGSGGQGVEHGVHCGVQRQHKHRHPREHLPVTFSSLKYLSFQMELS